MVSPYGPEPSKMLLRGENQKSAIYCRSNAGPLFRGVCDLYVSIASNANTSGSSYSNLGRTYQCSEGYHYTFFTGTEKFIVTDYEMFGIN